MIGQKTPIAELPVTLGLFAAAAFRLMPSVNRAIFAIQSSRFFGSVVDTLYSEFRLIDANPAVARGGPMPLAKSLAIDRVSFRYPATDAYALRDVSLTIPHGTSVGIIGSSGAGKSTLVDVILGLLIPESGAVLVDGVDTHNNLRRWQDQIGYVPQTIYLTDDTLRRNVAFGLANERIDEAAVLRAIHAAQLDEFVKESPRGLDTIVGERGVRLSGGQRQRIGIARALYHDPPVLVLDEATSSLDTLTEGGVIDAVRALQGDKTVIIVAHRFSTVEHCDRIFRLDRSKLVEEASAAEMLRTPGRLAVQHPSL
jgi:ABC-type multidrug transport system fused ATPase/permease subunit